MTANTKTKDISFWKKIPIFLNKERFTVAAGIIVFSTWCFENITLDNYKKKISDFQRLDNAALQMMSTQRILELETNLTSYNQAHYNGDTATFQSDYKTNIGNELLNQMEVIYLMRMLSDPDDDSVKAIKKEHTDIYAQDQMVFSENNFVKIVNYRIEQASIFSDKVTKLNSLKQEGLNRINEEMQQKRNQYFILYGLSAIFFSLGRIENVKKE
ncbi:MAG: hypothetical protein ABI091_17785 [Ferruginibacter sp.]